MSENSLTKDEVKHIAKLANLPVTEEEIIKFQKQLSETVDYIKTLSSVATQGVEPTSQVTGLKNVTRTDEPAPSQTQEEALSNAKNTHNGFIKVKAIFNEQT
ncbi:Asp-tRNA(Asn)/Glu-tRNA(Gln) amidotransferase subunit GatC [Candidatus Gottesmanbacteria bacterium]|nr:Asp-tRNA(Asn)/Glu-tRNA(Gln) amidotransferase subunit GatC [Candidatus Gottesmanbacteria bacterium]